MSFEVCKLSSCFNHSTINDIIKGNKLLKKAKRERAFLKFDSPGKKENFRIACFIEVSLGNVKDGEAQGSFRTYLVGDNKICSPIVWQSKKLCRIPKSAIAAEKLVRVDSVKSCFWLANLLNEILNLT